MFGADTSSLEELLNTVTQLEDLKIEIKEQPTEIDEINTSIENMKQQINQVDKNILASETNIETEIVISEDSNFNTIFSNLDVLTQKVNEQVVIETERKAKEERILKEHTEKQAYVGTYKNYYGNIATITINESGELYFKVYEQDYKIDMNQKNSDGSITIYTNHSDLWASTNIEYYIYPINTNLSVMDNEASMQAEKLIKKETDNTKIRIYIVGGDVPDINDTVYYKVD